MASKVGRRSLLVITLLACQGHLIFVHSWNLNGCTFVRNPFPSSSSKVCSSSVILQVSKDVWSVADDWSALSSENPQNSSPDSSTLFNQNPAYNAARAFEAEGTLPLTDEDLWINDVVDEIHNSFSTLDDPPLYDTGFDTDEGYAATMTVNSLDEMGNEIAMLVRCNEHPEDLLISQGRALAPLTEQEKNDVFQLVQVTKGKFTSTDFLRDSVSTMFHRHATPDKVDGALCLDRSGVAQWMTQSLRSEKQGRVSAHDKRVLKIISDFSSYGSGRLLEDDFQQLYLSTIVGDISKLSSGSVTPKRHLQLRQPFIDSVWRDIRNHGIKSPVEKERERLVEEIRAKNGGHIHKMENSDSFMDECEILDWDYRPQDSVSRSAKLLSERVQASGSMSSHKLVEMAPDKKTPLWVRDGEFVFIDEESCIGCIQCVNVAPNSFLMLESGRARTFKQRHSPDVQQAVASCPVSCMHPVSYKELQEYETARDEGDGRMDHKHLGHQRGHTPLYVARMQSDNNHRSSWYHTLKDRCLASGQCPQNACYDCPKYNKPGENPYFKSRHREAEHTRAQYFIEHGDVDPFRKTADL